MVSCWGTRLESRLESKIKGSFIPDSSFLQLRQLFYKWNCGPHGLKTNWFQISRHLEDAKVQLWRPNNNFQSLQFYYFFSRMFGRAWDIFSPNLQPFYQEIPSELITKLVAMLPRISSNFLTELVAILPRNSEWFYHQIGHHLAKTFEPFYHQIKCVCCKRTWPFCRWFCVDFVANLPTNWKPFCHWFFEGFVLRGSGYKYIRLRVFCSLKKTKWTALFCQRAHRQYMYLKVRSHFSEYFIK